MANEDIIIKIRADISDLEKDLANVKAQYSSTIKGIEEKGIKPKVDTAEVERASKSMVQNMGDVNRAASQIFRGDVLDGLRNLNQSLGEFKTGAVSAFNTLKTSGVTSLTAIRTALIATGIGAFAVAVGLIAANWDKIKLAITGTNSAQKALNDLAQKNLETARQKTKELNNQENTLRLQGKSEKEIRQIKLDALNYEIKRAEIALQTSIDQANSQYKAEVRNKRILAGALEFISAPLTFLLKNIDAIGERFGKNFGLFNGFTNQLASFAFDPAELKAEKDKEINEDKSRLKDLKNTRDGLILDSRKKEKDSSKEVKEAREKDFKDYANTVKTGTEQLIETEKDYAEFEARLDKEEEERAENIFNEWKDQEEEKKRIRKENEDARAKYESNEQKQREENIRKIQQTAAVAQQAYSLLSTSLFNADTQKRQEELEALKVEQEEELRLAGDNEQKKDVIRQKYALREKEIKRKQAEADKRKAIFDATVGTAVAVIQALPNFVLAAVAGALGTAQIALIAATPIPKFAKGGAVPSSDIQGMINGRPHEAGGVLIEAEGNEFITRKSQAMKGENLGLLEAINMSDSERDAYINRHYVMPALQAKESKANEVYRHSMIEAENNLIAKISSHTLKSIHREQKNTTEAIKRLDKKDFKW